ncbi:hypothetical protein SAMN02745126_04306 [Enhydrobacter aerosaccus]|uniref:DUF1365 domain-containing protein n=1 Tax=Enhydrobacter aerosaccus TaxID=225324 RepID=A0A1T4S2A5_9HYPH|nr:DUF1365 domain-containing protein [Enhydrobacter aerosaccus]SKA22364.1 hypothetical protein SAMN02745126_04306 [Enhydrobacter aerosaccus]
MTVSHTVVDSVVVHRRTRPATNSFRYRVPYLCLNLDALDHVGLHRLKIDRPGLVAFYRKDHGARDGGDLLTWIRAILASHGLADRARGAIVLMTLPRLLGFVFNPVSFWFCHDTDGSLQAVLCEVNNTFGESHCYLVHHTEPRPLEPQHWVDGRKVFHVSPFLPVDGTYRFRFRFEVDRVLVDVQYHDSDGLLLKTSVGGQRKRLDDPQLLRHFLLNPTATFSVVARIHWQALRLWRKGIRWYRKPPPPRTAVTRSTS